MPKRDFSCEARSQAVYRFCYARPMRSTFFAFVVLTAVIAAAQAPQPWTLKIQPIQLAAERGSNGPQLSVSKKGVALVSWLESGDEGATLKFAERAAN